MSTQPPAIETGVFILLPVLNEIANIGPLLDQIETALKGIRFTVGILDDGSTDGTIEYVQERMERPGQSLHLIRRKKTLRASQRGGALRTLMLWGLEHTAHEIFIEMDGDLSHRPEELRDGIRMLTEGRYDIAIASKYVPGSAVVNRPWGRLLVSKLCSYAVRSLLSAKVRDYSNGYRFYTRAAARLAANHAYRYGSPIYLSEILALWLRSGLRVGEFKTVYVGRNEGVSKLRIADLVKAGIAIFEIAGRYHFGGFRTLPQASAEFTRAKRSGAGGE
jgi:dolichol-phosphate mannosyltransferase